MINKLYKTLVWPIIDYSNAVWGHTFISDQRKIENVQCKAVSFLEASPIKSDFDVLQTQARRFNINA